MAVIPFARRAPREPARARLLALLRTRRDDVGPFSFATEETLAVARELAADESAAVVSSILEAYTPGGDVGLAARAAHVAHELALRGAVPALVSCVVRLPDLDPVASVAGAALELVGRPATDALLDALAGASSREVRGAVGRALVLMPADDGRVGAALESMLAYDPELAGELLGERGDDGALPALRDALDRLELPARGEGQGEAEVERLDAIVAVGGAIRALEGRLTPAQRRKLDRALARHGELAAAELRELAARRLH
jgi:hypothetical protein